jgi:hypothetical protein
MVLRFVVIVAAFLLLLLGRRQGKQPSLANLVACAAAAAVALSHLHLRHEAAVLASCKVGVAA